MHFIGYCETHFEIVIASDYYCTLLYVTLFKLFNVADNTLWVIYTVLEANDQNSLSFCPNC